MAREPGRWMNVAPSLPLTEATATVDGVEIYYRTGGSGPPLLLLHGFTLSGQQWDPFVDELGKDHTLIIPDLPGLGRSARPSGDFTHREAARRPRGMAAALGIERVRRVGPSSGAIVLLHMALQRPDRMDAMVLVAGAHRLPLAVRMERRARAGRMDQYDAQHLALMRRFQPGGEPQIRWVAAQFDRMGDNFVDWDLSPEHLATIQTRTLLIWGDRDANFDIEFALEMYRAMPKAALWVIPGESHGALWSSEEARAMFPGVARRFFQGEIAG